MASRAETPTYPVPWTYGRVASWIATVDHKRIGILYIATSLVFFLAGGVMALLIRTQLATPRHGFRRSRRLQPALHDARHDDDLPGRRPDLRRLRELHGSLMIGAADMAFRA